MVFAETIKLDTKVAERLLKKVVSMSEKNIKICNESHLPKDMKDNMIRLIKGRISRLK